MRLLNVGHRIGRHSTGRPGRMQGGFTLLELIVVLVILGLMTALAMPMFYSYYQEHEAQKTTEQLTRVFRFAQQEAIFQRKVRTVGIDFDSNTYFVKADPLPGEYDFEIRRRHQTPLPEGFEFDSLYFPDLEDETNSQIGFFNFYPNGTADKIRLTIQRFDKRGFSTNLYIIRVNDVTGQVRVRDRKTDEERYL